VGAQTPLFQGVATDSQLLDGIDSAGFLSSTSNDTTSGTLGILNLPHRRLLPSLVLSFVCHSYLWEIVAWLFLVRIWCVILKLLNFQNATKTDVLVAE
jgi:hypothetical protein